MDGWEAGTLESRQGLTDISDIYCRLGHFFVTYHLLPFKSNCLEAEMDMRWKDACRCSSDRKVFLRGEMLYGVHSYWWLCISFSVNLPLVESSVSWETSIRNAISISYLLDRSMYAENAHRPSNSRNLSLKTHRQQQAVDACNKAPILVTDDEIFEEYSANDLPRSCRCARCILPCFRWRNWS